MCTYQKKNNIPIIGYLNTDKMNFSSKTIVLSTLCYNIYESKKDRKREREKEREGEREGERERERERENWKCFFLFFIQKSGSFMKNI